MKIARANIAQIDSESNRMTMLSATVGSDAFKLNAFECPFVSWPEVGARNYSTAHVAVIISRIKIANG